MVGDAFEGHEAVVLGHRLRWVDHDDLPVGADDQAGVGSVERALERDEGQVGDRGRARVDDLDLAGPGDFDVGVG
jgi:hypothetical protein